MTKIKRVIRNRNLSKTVLFFSMNIVLPLPTQDSNLVLKFDINFEASIRCEEKEKSIKKV